MQCTHVHPQGGDKTCQGSKHNILGRRRERRKGGGGGIQEREGLRDGKGRRKKGRRERQWRGRVGGEIRREGGRRREEEK